MKTDDSAGVHRSVGTGASCSPSEEESNLSHLEDHHGLGTGLLLILAEHILSGEIELVGKLLEVEMVWAEHILSGEIEQV